MNLDLKQLRIARIKANLTICQLATISGIHRATLSKIEKGYQIPTPKTINKIAKALNVGIEDIVI